MPTRPSVAMKAKASGTPAKLADTPQRRAHPARQATHDSRVRQQETKKTAPNRRNSADLNAQQIGLKNKGLKKVADVGEREPALIVLKAKKYYESRGQHEEQERKNEKRNDAEPRP